jgi:hypothetical protein
MHTEAATRTGIRTRRIIPQVIMDLIGVVRRNCFTPAKAQKIISNAGT